MREASPTFFRSLLDVSQRDRPSRPRLRHGSTHTLAELAHGLKKKESLSPVKASQNISMVNQTVGQGQGRQKVGRSREGRNSCNDHNEYTTILLGQPWSRKEQRATGEKELCYIIRRGFTLRIAQCRLFVKDAFGIVSHQSSARAT